MLNLNQDSIQVLLIEDDEDDYLITKELLADIPNHQYQLEWVSDYEAAMKAIDINQYDVILVDFYLGMYTGLEILKAAREKDCQAPIVMLTGLGDRDVDNQAMKAGAADYLVKGKINSDLLERAIRHSIARKRIEKELRESEARFRALAQKEKLLNYLGQQIRNSLELNVILEKALLEICNLLDVHRCLFIWYYPNNDKPYYELVRQSCQPDTTEFLSDNSLEELKDLCQILSGLNRLETGCPFHLIPNLDGDFLKKFGWPVILMVPIFKINYLGGKTGILICEDWYQFFEKTSHWEESKVELLLAVAAQIALAISQAELYEKARISQEKSERLLLNILPATIAHRLKSHEGTSIADSFEEVTVLFADIVNFTEMSSQMPAVKMVNKLNLIFSNFDILAEQYNLEKIKTIGDAYMVVGGVPISRPDHAEAVADMALDMQRTIQNFFQDNGKPFALRIGINSGSAVAGVIGTKKFIYDLWGDTVNVASRMESYGETGKIQVTETTYQKLKNKYVFEKRGALEIKGKGTMVTYWLMGKKSA